MYFVQLYMTLYVHVGVNMVKQAQMEIGVCVGGGGGGADEVGDLKSRTHPIDFVVLVFCIYSLDIRHNMVVQRLEIREIT